MFYSRRISDNLINATKVTGKTKGNLGIGFLNAIANETDQQPLSNFNIFTIDQSLANNSFISITNTNVNKKKEGWANVTGLTSSLKNKRNSYQLKSAFNFSLIDSQARL